jgi:1-acyl-sn-glycerol-3-phosphate acyltransferase
MEAACLETSLAGKAEFKKIPFINSFSKAAQNIFIERGSSQSGLDAQVELIGKRQEMNEVDTNLFPLALFPEATTTNGDYII